ncbi:AMP-binding protein [Sorangium sp. So ce726]|uniref:AMP-binding protein n=1 Tax=Sorangium sp. So ce726 TaxID=3133319 RepID=UPI003F63CECF
MDHIADAHPADLTSLVDLLQQRAALMPAHPVFTVLRDGGDEAGRLTFSELDRQARSVAAHLEQRGLRGQRAVLLFPTGLDFIASFFGCLYAGMLAVPAPPPEPSRLARSLPRLRSIAADARPAVILTDRDGVALAGRAAEHAPELGRIPWVPIDECLAAPAEAWRPSHVERRSIAYLQYTSGSTSLPKGTILTHGNVLRNCRAIQQGKRYTKESVSLMWVPNYHDDGLVHGIIHPVFSGCRAILMSPLSFIARPVRWLEAITWYRATHSGGPNFAYELCLRKVTNAERDTLDLSSWKLAYNAAEPVRAETLRRFHERFEPCGFRWTSFAPSFGLAEATLTVSTKGDGEGPRLLALDGAALEREHKVRRAPEGEPSTRLLVGCGQPVGEARIAIVEPETARRCRPDEVGEIWIQSPCVAAGYAGRPEETESTFCARLADTGEGPFLRTGDLGFMADGELFITGRSKDLILVRGENRYPQDIEWTVQGCHRDIRPGGVAAFSVDAGGEERLAVAVEVNPPKREGGPAAPGARWHEALFTAIQQAIAEAHGLEVAAIELLEAGAVPKTSSGKTQRRACREALQSGAIAPLARWSRAATDQQGPITAPEQAARRDPGREEIQAFLVAHLVARCGVEAGSIDVDAPFARLGVDSATGVTLAATLGDWLGRELPHTALWDHPTIRALSDALALTRPAPNGSAQGSARLDAAIAKGAPVEAAADRAPGGAPGASPAPGSVLVELRPITTRQPFFCVGGLLGLATGLWTLACFLGDERPFYALQSPGLDGKERPLRRVEELAARYLQEIRKVQPKGPYIVGGYSSGGLVAYEMARQLRAEGQDISRVVLLDTMLNESGSRFAEASRSASIFELADMLRRIRNEPQALSYDDVAGMSGGEQIELLRESLKRSSIHLTGPQVETVLEVHEVSIESMHRYDPPPSDLPVTLFTAEVRIPLFVHPSRGDLRPHAAPDFGWERVCGEALAIHEVPGNHLSMVQSPHVGRLAQLLKEDLRTCSAAVKLRAAPALNESFPYR